MTDGPTIRETPQQAIARRSVERAREAGFTWPDGWEVNDLGFCRSCKAPILWCITPKGHRAPVDRDGKSHFASCPDAQGWRTR